MSHDASQQQQQKAYFSKDEVKVEQEWFKFQRSNNNKVQAHVYMNKDGILPGQVMDDKQEDDTETRAAWMRLNGLQDSDEEGIEVLPLDDSDSDADELVIHVPRPKN
jgi:hypothetical protein